MMFAAAVLALASSPSLLDVSSCGSTAHASRPITVYVGVHEALPGGSRAVLQIRQALACYAGDIVVVDRPTGADVEVYVLSSSYNFGWSLPYYIGVKVVSRTLLPTHVDEQSLSWQDCARGIAAAVRRMLAPKGPAELGDQVT